MLEDAVGGTSSNRLRHLSPPLISFPETGPAFCSTHIYVSFTPRHDICKTLFMFLRVFIASFAFCIAIDERCGVGIYGRVAVCGPTKTSLKCFLLAWEGSFFGLGQKLNWLPKDNYGKAHTNPCHIHDPCGNNYKYNDNLNLPSKGFEKSYIYVGDIYVAMG